MCFGQNACHKSFRPAFIYPSLFLSWRRACCIYICVMPNIIELISSSFLAIYMYIFIFFDRTTDLRVVRKIPFFPPRRPIPFSITQNSLTCFLNIYIEAKRLLKMIWVLGSQLENVRFCWTYITRVQQEIALQTMRQNNNCTDSTIIYIVIKRIMSHIIIYTSPT